MQDNPLVSVIIPTFNRADILHRAIDSVVNQEYTNWELLVVDDRSTDDTTETIKEYLSRVSRIKYLINDHKKGPAGARNTGIANAQGKYIAFLDSDDEWLPHHLKTCVEALEKEPVDLCFSLWLESSAGKLTKIEEMQGFREDFEKAFDTLKPEIKGDLVFFGDSFFEYAIMEYFYCYHINTIVLKKSILDATGTFNENLRSSEDVDFVYRLLESYKFCLIKDHHFIYYEGQDNIYNFIDRNNIDVSQLVYNKKLVEGMNRNGTNKNEMWKNLKELVGKSPGIKDKKKCIKVINERIALKYFTLGFINARLSKVRALGYYLNSLAYKPDRARLLFLFKLLFPVYQTDNTSIISDLDFW